MKRLFIAVGLILTGAACQPDEDTPAKSTAAIEKTFGSKVNINAPPNYAAQSIPAYITKDNARGNAISDKKALLGRVLFYDKKLSANNSIACASCHQQQHAFSDLRPASQGVNGLTGRHSMRLVNARFSNEVRFFWDERAATLEAQTTQPIQDHAEMGFSGQNGAPNLTDLLAKLKQVDYYQELFTHAYGDANITEARLQECLSQFVRSIQSFDSKYDAGRATVNNDGQPFANFTTAENTGKALFLAPPIFNADGQRVGGGAGCNGCHQAPEFDIDPQSRNNGVIGTVSGTDNDLNVTRAPSLRDLLKADGSSNGPFMHIGTSNQVITVINHYNDISLAGNNNLDPRLRPNNRPQKLQLTNAEKDALVAFLRTLTGKNIYTDSKWADPFAP
jgi:cytochrome c peroxidase